MEMLKHALLFLFGEPHKAMYTGLTFTGVNFILDFFRKYDPPKKVKQIARGIGKKLLAYSAFVIIATRIDALAIGALMGWEGSTQFLVFLYILTREIRSIFDYIREQGIEIPGILSSRIEQVEQHANGNSGDMSGMSLSGEITGIHNMPVNTDPVSIDEKIAQLQQQMASLQNKNETGGERP